MQKELPYELTKIGAEVKKRNSCKGEVWETPQDSSSQALKTNGSEKESKPSFCWFFFYYIQLGPDGPHSEH